jgi:hypothetical protein
MCVCMCINIQNMFVCVCVCVCARVYLCMCIHPMSSKLFSRIVIKTLIIIFNMLYHILTEERHNSYHKDIQHNDIKRIGFICDTQHKRN